MRGNRDRIPLVSASIPGATAPDWFVHAIADAPVFGEVTVDDARVSYRAWGASREGANDVLLVHGGAAHSGWWDHLAPLLADGRRVVAVDMSGHGDSDHRAEYSLDGWADELAAVIGASGLSGPPVVVGHSMGGMAAATLAGRPDAGLSGVILVDSPVGVAGREARGEAGRPSFGLARRYATKAEAIARFHPVPAQPVLDYVAAHIAEQSVREYAGGWSWKFDPAFIRIRGGMLRALDGLQTPGVMIAAERGILSAEARDALRAANEVVVIDIEDAGHAIMLDRPLVLLGVVRDALSAWES